MTRQNNAEQQEEPDLTLALFAGAIGANLSYHKVMASRMDDGTILIATKYMNLGGENLDALKGFAHLYINGPKIISDNVGADDGWINIQRGLGQALTEYFARFSGPANSISFAVLAVYLESKQTEVSIEISGNISNDDHSAIKEQIDRAMAEIDRLYQYPLYQTGKVRLEDPKAP